MLSSAPQDTILICILHCQRNNIPFQNEGKSTNDTKTIIKFINSFTYVNQISCYLMSICSKPGCVQNCTHACGQCGAFYCTKVCQSLDWNDHKIQCKLTALSINFPLQQPDAKRLALEPNPTSPAHETNPTSRPTFERSLSWSDSDTDDDNALQTPRKMPANPPVKHVPKILIAKIADINWDPKNEERLPNVNDFISMNSKARYHPKHELFYNHQKRLNTMYGTLHRSDQDFHRLSSEMKLKWIQHEEDKIELLWGRRPRNIFDYEESKYFSYLRDGMDFLETFWVIELKNKPTTKSSNKRRPSKRS